MAGGSRNVISVQIKGDNKELISSLEQSSAQIRKTAREQAQRNKEMQQGWDNLKGSIGGIGVAIAGAFAAKEVFDQFINSTQITSDTFGREMAGMKNMVDSFFSSVNSNNFAGFISNLAKVRQAAKDAFDMEDILADMKLSDTVIDAKTKAEGEKYKTDYKKAKAAGDTTGMKQAQESYTALIDDFWRETMITQEQTLKTAIAQTNKYLAQFGLKAGQDDILTYATKTNKEDPAMKAIVDNFNNVIKVFDSRIVAGMENSVSSKGVVKSTKTDDAKLAGKQKAAYIEANKYAAIQAKLYNQADDLRAQIFGNLADYYKLAQGYQQFRGAGAKIDQGVANLEAKETKKPEVKVPALRDTAFNDLLDEDPDATALAIRLEGQIAGLWVDATAEARAMALKKLGEMESDGTGLTFSGKQFEIQPPKISDLDSATAAFGEMANVMGSIGQLADNNASKMLQWASSSIGAIGQVISITGALIAVKEAEGSANAKAALTGVAASVASIPILGPILAIGAIASLAAAFLSMPKFATGGIVGGNSYSGDKVPAMLNSGEIVMNGYQQAQLWNFIQHGSKAQPNEVRIRIKGSDLVGAMTNYNSKKGRVL